MLGLHLGYLQTTYEAKTNLQNMLIDKLANIHGSEIKNYDRKMHK